MASNGTQVATLILVSATWALDVYSTLNSSPQTTELFADDREDSLMHWVMIGGFTAMAGGTVGTIVSESPWPLLAAAGVVVMMHLMYRHAVKRGTGCPAPSAASDY